MNVDQLVRIYHDVQRGNSAAFQSLVAAAKTGNPQAIADLKKVGDVAQADILRMKAMQGDTASQIGFNDLLKTPDTARLAVLLSQPPYFTAQISYLAAAQNAMNQIYAAQNAQLNAAQAGAYGAQLGGCSAAGCDTGCGRW